MANNKSVALQQELGSAYALIQDNKAALAISKLKPLQKKWQSNADVEHLLALAYMAEGNIQQAKNYFSRSLSINKKQPQAHNNLANLYKSEKKFDQAETHYRLAISLHADFLDAIRNLAICLNTQKKYSSAIDLYKKVLAINPGDVSALTGLADCYRELGLVAEAHENYSKAINLAPAYVNAWHNLGLNHHLNGELEMALDCYKHAFQLSPDEPVVLMSLASAMNETGSTSEAISLFQHALQNKPDEINLHERLNEIIWESEFSQQFGDSFRKAIELLPNNIDLRLALITQLFQAGETNLANQETSKALQKFGNSYQLLSLNGQIQAEALDYDSAYKSLSDSLSIQFTKLAAQALTKLSLIQEKYEQAQSLLDQLMKHDEDCQLTWGLQSLVWRLTNDERYFWLNDYEKFVQPFQLEAPDRYSSLDEFLAALESVLLSLHQTENAPLQQTLRNGTQTAARLLHKPIPELLELKQCLTNIVKAYIDNLPDDPDHPLLNRKSDMFDFSGSWSVKLRPDGFHVSHVHPAGWISSSVYISMPGSMQGDDSLQGSIKFGESPLYLGDREVVEKTIKPNAGSVVLFPSYMWHGTYPFEGDEGDEGDFRLTSPFDIIPL